MLSLFVVYSAPRIISLIIRAQGNEIQKDLRVSGGANPTPSLPAPRQRLQVLLELSWFLHRYRSACQHLPTRSLGFGIMPDKHKEKSFLNGEHIALSHKWFCRNQCSFQPYLHASCVRPKLAVYLSALCRDANCEPLTLYEAGVRPQVFLPQILHHAEAVVLFSVSHWSWKQNSCTRLAPMPNPTHVN